MIRDTTEPILAEPTTEGNLHYHLRAESGVLTRARRALHAATSLDNDATEPDDHSSSWTELSERQERDRGVVLRVHSVLAGRRGSGLPLDAFT